MTIVVGMVKSTQSEVFPLKPHRSNSCYLSEISLLLSNEIDITLFTTLLYIDKHIHMLKGSAEARIVSHRYCWKSDPHLTLGS